MKLADSYAGLARLFDYPQGKHAALADHNLVAGYLGKHNLACPTAPFVQFLTASSEAEIQEDYVATFDFNPAAAPYLGHHLYGDNQKKGAYMIRVKQEFGRYGFTSAGYELPDHLGVLLTFLAHLARLGQDVPRRQFISEAVLPGLDKFSASFASRGNSPWKSLIEVAAILCTADSKEITTC